MTDVSEVPHTLTNPINLKIIGIIIAIVIGFHIFINLVDDSDYAVYGFSIAIPGSVAASSFVIAKRYSGAFVYSKAYSFLGIGFTGIFLGEITYLIYEQFLGLDPYPSIADIFFFLFYPMVSLYMIVNIRFFSPETQLIDKISISLIPIAITVLYVFMTLSEELTFDFYYGLAFVAATTTALGLSIYAARIFKDGIVGSSWLILVVGLLLLVGGDTWYYYIELFEGYSLDHLVNLFWYAGYLLILYSLFKHKSAL